MTTGGDPPRNVRTEDTGGGGGGGGATRVTPHGDAGGGAPEFISADRRGSGREADAINFLNLEENNVHLTQTKADRDREFDHLKVQVVLAEGDFHLALQAAVDGHNHLKQGKTAMDKMYSSKVQKAMAIRGKGLDLDRSGVALKQKVETLKTAATQGDLAGKKAVLRSALQTKATDKAKHDGIVTAKQEAVDKAYKELKEAYQAAAESAKKNDDKVDKAYKDVLEASVGAAETAFYDDVEAFQAGATSHTADAREFIEGIQGEQTGFRSSFQEAINSLDLVFPNNVDLFSNALDRATEGMQEIADAEFRHGSSIGPLLRNVESGEREAARRQARGARNRRTSTGE